MFYWITWSFYINYIKRVGFAAIKRVSCVWSLEEESCFPLYAIFQVSLYSSRIFSENLRAKMSHVIDWLFVRALLSFHHGASTKTDNLFALQNNVSCKKWWCPILWLCFQSSKIVYEKYLQSNIFYLKTRWKDRCELFTKGCTWYLIAIKTAHPLYKHDLYFTT